MDTFEVIRKYGFAGSTKEEAIIFCEDQSNNFQVDCPKRFQGMEEIEYSNKSKMFKEFRKYLKTLK